MNLDPACFFAAIFWGKKLHEIKSEEKTRAHRVPFTFLLLAHTRTQISVVPCSEKSYKAKRPNKTIKFHSNVEWFLNGY